MKGLLIVILSLLLINGNSQELNCQVQVIAPTLQSNPANQEIIESLQSSIFEFVNNTNHLADSITMIHCSFIMMLMQFH